jgi:hypothetical protein
LNLYAYAGNAPVNLVDPDGTGREPVPQLRRPNWANNTLWEQYPVRVKGNAVDRYGRQLLDQYGQPLLDRNGQPLFGLWTVTGKWNRNEEKEGKLGTVTEYKVGY